jgi:diaminopimelate decarboxylase
VFRNVLTRRILSAATRAARRRPTPFYLFDPAELLRQASAWRRAADAAEPAEVFYPYKCNRAAPVVEILARRGLGAEVTTLPDLQTAAGLGLSGQRLVVQGPAKSAALLDAGLAAGALFVADGREDALALLSRARAVGTTPRYLLRFAPCAASEEQRTFGLPACELLALAREISRRGATAPEGLAFHLGTGIPSTAPYLRALAEVAALGVPIERLDMGGGFAAHSESRLDARGRPRPAGTAPEAILSPLARSARRLFGPGVRLAVEPGRALVSGSFHLIARVVRVREAAGQTTVYIDASRLSHAFFVALGRHPIAALPARRGPRRDVCLAGPLGVGLDVFTSTARIPLPAPGDLIVIGSVGAYNLNAANGWAGPIAPVVSLSPSPGGRGSG